MAVSKPKELNLSICWRCNVKLTKRTILTSINCKQCCRLFHRKCYLADTGINDITSNCVCCLSGVARDLVPILGRHRQVVSKFLQDGFCVISLTKGSVAQKNVIQTLERCRKSAERCFSAFMNSYNMETGLSKKVPTLDTGFSNFRQRDKGRYEMISPEIESEVLSIVNGCDMLSDILDILLTTVIQRTRTKKRIMATGCFYSLPGSSGQTIHTDGPSLSSVVDLCPYAVNVFVPLVPVDKNNGTMFFPGSHCVKSSSDESSRSKGYAPTVPLGSALLFDYRVLHRGLANKRGTARPCYYVTFSRSWYEDKFNFSKERYKTTLNVPSYLLETRSGEATRKRGRLEQ